MPKRAQYKYVYFVEGKCEEKLVNILKQNMKLIQAGKVYCINPVQTELKLTHLRTISSNTIAVLIFDTDVKKQSSIEMLQKNIKLLKKMPHVKEVLCIPQCECFEDEIVHCTNMEDICAMFGLTSKREFKGKFLSVHEDNIVGKLKEYQFQIDELWNGTPNDVFKDIENKSYKIKIK